MVRITRDEKKAIHKERPDLPISRTMRRRSKRHRYYMCEEPEAMELLASIRGE